MVSWLVDAIMRVAPPDSFLSHGFNVRAFLAIILVSLICGSFGSLVVGNRMAFFSDALAHCAFAGLALGLMFGLALGQLDDDVFKDWAVPAVMTSFGILVGVLIAYVRESTTLASDTVIGVFFAGAIGLGAMFIKVLSRRRFSNPEGFMFGDPIAVSEHDLGILLGLAALSVVFLWLLYNPLIFTSFNVSLARSRRIPVRLCSYLFVIFLALIVNLCLKTVGVLLINAFLIVPAATAANVCRNMRQLFWVTTGLCLGEGLLGLWLSWAIEIPNPSNSGDPITFGIGGTIVVVSVVIFYLSLVAGPRIRGRQALQ